MRYDKIMQEVLPKVLVEYFTIVDMRSQADKIEFWLDEKEYMEREDYKKGTVRSYGFTQSRPSRTSLCVASLCPCMCAAAGVTVPQARYSRTVMMT